MKNRIVVIALCIWGCISVSAQDKPQYYQDIRFGVGVRGPLGSAPEWGSSEILSLSYAHYNLHGIGMRTGVEFMPQNMKVDSYFGVPVAFSIRTRPYSFKESLAIGVESAAYGAVRDVYSGYGPSASSVIGDFLLGLFNRMEFFAGLTPGYIAGKNTPVRTSYSGNNTTVRTMVVQNRFSLTADAGLSMSLPIWRFNFGFVPAVHYYLTKNYRDLQQTVSVVSDSDVSTILSDTPVRFQFSVLGALSFSF